ncbi:hypothetical protein QA601_08935 [Chitinispirillales bacterium ANBcel5]|uniref:hypothetical protein n=1 Tax=Cellulosispirillum alkaliphilum TaxID=3039283 RepID=UPI002A52A7B7|nr:hypothetical protein [Chitinispirillales bacterium ANBcel5]
MDKFFKEVPIKAPKIAVSSIAQKANDIVVRCRYDREDLEKAHFDWKKTDRLTVLGIQCMHVEADLVLCREGCRKETAQLNRYIDKCRRLRREIVTKMRAVNDLKPLSAQIPSYAKSKCRADLVQDLHDLNYLGRYLKDELEGTGFDMSLIQKAYDESWKLSHLIADTIINRDSIKAATTKRNGVIRETVDLIYDIGAFARRVFRNDPRKHFYYTSKKYF